MDGHRRGPGCGGRTRYPRPAGRRLLLPGGRSGLRSRRVGHGAGHLGRLRQRSHAGPAGFRRNRDRRLRQPTRRTGRRCHPRRGSGGGAAVPRPELPQHRRPRASGDRAAGPAHRTVRLPAREGGLSRGRDIAGATRRRGPPFRQPGRPGRPRGRRGVPTGGR